MSVRPISLAKTLILPEKGAHHRLCTRQNGGQCLFNRNSNFFIWIITAGLLFLSHVLSVWCMCMGRHTWQIDVVIYKIGNFPWIVEIQQR